MQLLFGSFVMEAPSVASVNRSLCHFQLIALGLELLEHPNEDRIHVAIRAILDIET